MSNYIKELITRPLKSFPNYIEHIRFPLFKKITPNTKITFDFPFTAFVGPNGCGKTSALQALYGCPKGMSTGDFWFSTIIDPIHERSGSGAYRYIYQYTISTLKKSVEVIKTKTKKTGNPDYWETAKPRIKDSMNPIPKEYPEHHKEHRNKTRWNPVNKKVVYIDFKAELSAFDKFFNFGSFTSRKSIKTKQDFLRHRSKPLQSAFINSGTYPQFHSKKVYENKLLNENELTWISRILGKKYTEAKFINHDFFDKEGISILFKEEGNQYSEAVAGSGEVAVVSCVQKVLCASTGSLILLDEPEVSLHPGAQRELRALLLDQIMNNDIQVVISTHSPELIRDLPSNAIKIFHRSGTTGTYDVLNKASPEQAFIRLGSVVENITTIYVEDSLSKALVKKALQHIDPELNKAYCVKVYPGGGPKIKNDLLVNIAVTDNKNTYVLLDGDQKIHDNILDPDDIEPAKHNNLASIVKKHIGVSLSFPLDGGNANNNDQKIALHLKALKAYSNRFFFGNTQTPEDLIWEICSYNNCDLEKLRDEPCAKDRLRKYAEAQLGTTNISANEILFSQRTLINEFSHDDEPWLEFIKIVADIVDGNAN